MQKKKQKKTTTAILNAKRIYTIRNRWQMRDKRYGRLKIYIVTTAENILVLIKFSKRTQKILQKKNTGSLWLGFSASQ